jgi:hypothetical protein
MFKSRYMPCPECGASVDRSSEQGHECSRERWADFQMFGLRAEIARLETGLEQFLRTTTGRFETWLAARQVRAGD